MAEEQVQNKLPIRERPWFFPLIWLEWDEKGERWVFFKWVWEW
jgi:hypothetical protein